MTSQEKARALVARLLNGDLVRVEHVEQRHELRFPTPLLPARRTPVTSVTSVSVNGRVVDASDYSFTPFALAREDGEAWPAGFVRVTYATGWAEGSEPAEVKAALAQAAAWFDANPGTGVTSFREGAEAVTVDARQALEGIRALLQPWVRP